MQTIDTLRDILKQTRKAAARPWAIQAKLDAQFPGRFFPGAHSPLESARLPDGEWLEYFNAGDPYEATICRYRGRWIVASWGDVVEAAKKRLARMGIYTCSHCGELVERAKRRNPPCGNCHNPIFG